MKKIITLTLVFLLGVTYFAFADDVIELEVGSGALDEYKSFTLDSNDYKSEDSEVAYIEGNKLIAKEVGETYIVNDNNKIKVIVYYVGDELVPVGESETLGNKTFNSAFTNLIYIFFTIFYFMF